MLLPIHPKNPEPRKLRQVLAALEKGGLIIYPTDSVYAVGCDLFNRKAVESLCRLLKLKPQKLNLSFICRDLSNISLFVRRLETAEFKLLKRALPGPFTFIFEASNEVPKILGVEKKSVGIRIPNHAIPLAIAQELHHPLISASLKKESLEAYYTDPDEMFDAFKHNVDVVIDAGPGGLMPSTVVDFTTGQPVVLRNGLGDIDQFL